MQQGNRRPSKAKQTALSGMLFALAMALSFAEGSLTIPGLLPGMKLGLANVVVMYALLFMGGRAGSDPGSAQSALCLFGVRSHGGLPFPVRGDALAAGDVAAV